MIIHRNSGKIKRKSDNMDINELKRILEKNKNEILELWRSL